MLYWYGKTSCDVYDAINAMFIMSLPGVPSYQMTDLHTLLSLAVLPASSLQLNDCFVLKFKSESIGQRVLEQYGHLEPKQARRLLCVYRGNPQLGITAG